MFRKISVDVLIKRAKDALLKSEMEKGEAAHAH